MTMQPRLYPFAIRSLTVPPGLQPILRGVAGYASAELANRVVRLLAILVIARHTDAAMLGTAALALSLFELVRVLANVGIGQRIIVAHDAELEAICRTALRLFILLCAGVALFQLGVAGILAVIFGHREAGAMLAVLAGVYAFMPAGLVQIHLAMRERRLATTARIAATQAIADHLLTMALVVIWPSAWAIVLPKLLTAPLWTVLARRACPWKPRRDVAPAPAAQFRTFFVGVFGSEAMIALRGQADKLVIGAVLGVKALGIYYFAFGAGLGIAQSLVTAFGIVLFPNLAAEGDAGERSARMRAATLAGLACIVPFALFQAVAAPFYVPLVFGEQWGEAAHYVALLSLAAIPLFLAAAIGAHLRAGGKPGREAALSAAATGAALGGLSIGAQLSLFAACAGYAAGLALILFPAAARSLLPRRQTLHPARKEA